MENDSLYVGKSVNCESRKADHLKALRGKRHDNAHFQRAWDKYGENTFQFRIVHRVAEAVREANKTRVHTQESKEKQKVAMLGRQKSHETLARMSAAQKLRWSNTRRPKVC